MTRSDRTLVVLGAGPAGLGAAEHAAARGTAVTVLERADHVGGVAASETIGGVRVDRGSHRLHGATDPAVLAHLRTLLGDDLQRRPRRGRIRLAGRWLPFPLSPASLTALPAGFALRAAVDAATAWTRTPRADTFAEEIRAGLGPTMLARFYGPYATKLWGLPPEDVAGEQARRRVGARSPGAVLRRILAGRDPAARTFLYPRRGFGQIAESLAAAASAHGADVRLGSEVTALRPEEDGVTVATAGGDEVRARAVFSTIPLPVLARLCDPPPPPDVLAAARALRTRAMVLVHLVYDQAQATPYDAHYLPEAGTPVTRISEPKNYRDGRPGRDDPGDPHDRTVLTFEVPCDLGDRWWTASDEELAALATSTLAAVELPRPPVSEVAIRRLPHAYPVLDRVAPAHAALVEAWAATLPRVLTFGRQGLFVHDNTHHALAMAWSAVDALGPDGELDAAAWTTARTGFRQHVVED